MEDLGGPVIGYVGRKFGFRVTTICGCIVAAIGIGGCFFAEDIYVVTMFWGVVYGLGFGFSTALLPSILHLYFKSDGTLANGVALTGSSLGGLVLPVILKYLLSTYGLSGAQLIFSALVLNSIPAALLLKIPDSATFTSDKDRISSTNEFSCSNKDQEEKRQEKNKQLMYDSISKDNTSGDTPLKTQTGNSFPMDYFNHAFTTNYENIKASSKQSEIMPSLNEIRINKKISMRDLKMKRGQKLIISNHPSDTKYQSSPVILNAYNYQSYQDIKYPYRDSNIQPVPSSDTDQPVASTDTVHPVVIENFAIKDTSRNVISNVSKFGSFRIFWDPTFIVMMVTQGIYAVVVTIIWTIIVDYGRDKGIQKSNEVYFVMILPSSDMVGRLGLTWVTDRGHMTQIKFSLLCFFCVGISELLLLWSSDFVFIMLAEFVFSFFTGALTVMFPGVINEFMDAENRTMAMTSRYILHAPLSLLVSPLIGYFRGTVGSYDGILYLSSIMCLLSGGMTLLIPYLAKIRKRA